jgi:prophage DNA circulation protein
MKLHLHRRLTDLANNLGEFGPTEPVPRQIAEIFNVLLEETKKAHGEDPIVAQVQALSMASNEKYARTSCGALRATATQLASAFIR